jgi:hypothetical protein
VEDEFGQRNVAYNFIIASYGAVRVAQPRREALKSVHTIADDLESAKEWDSENQSGGSPNPGPEEKRQADSERI